MAHYIDLHRHGPNSDGIVNYEESIRLAYDAGIRTLCYTDHNVLTDLRHLELEKKYPQLNMIYGTEVSAVYHGSGGDREIHILGLGVNVDSKEFIEFLRKNKPDHRPYVEAILQSLKDNCGIELCSYDELREKYPVSAHLGRGHIAEEMVYQGYARDQDDAFDRFIGAKGAAYVAPPLRFMSMETIVSAIRKAGGVAVLAHPLFYHLTDAQLEELLFRFKSCGGQAMEVYYGAWSEEQMRFAKMLADKFGLMYSAGSDYHGRKTDCLHYFDLRDCLPLLMTIFEHQEREKRIWKHHGVGYVTENAMIEEIRNLNLGITVVETNDGSGRDLFFTLSKEPHSYRIIPVSKITRILVDALRTGGNYHQSVDAFLKENNVGSTILFHDIVPSATGELLGEIINEYGKAKPVLLACKNASDLYFLMAQIENGNLYSYVGAAKE